MTTATHRAFTLLELLAVVGLVLVLAAILFPVVGNFMGKANSARCVANLKSIGAASSHYSADNNGNWPPGGVGTVYSNFLVPYLGRIPGVKDSDFLRSPLICPGAQTTDPDGNYSHRGIYTPGSYVDPNTGKSVKYGLSYAQNVYAPGNVTEDGTPKSDAVPKRVLAENPSEMMLYMDMQGHYIVSVGGIAVPDRRYWLERRHGGNLNVAFADGSVRTLTFDDIPPANIPIRKFWSGKGKDWPD